MAMKKSEMNRGITYFICPDETCTGFDDACDSESYALALCDYDCPQKDRLKKVFICRQCDDIIKVPGTHRTIEAVDHACPDGRHPHILMPSHMTVIHEMPEED